MSGLLLGDSENIVQHKEGPGETLKAARQAQDLPLDEIADKLHLSVELLEAIEADDYEKLPAPVFVQGYLRNYARYLDEPVDPILKAYHETRSADGHHSTRKFVHRTQHEISSNHGGVRFVTWIMVIGLIALLFFWWKGYLDENSTDSLQQEIDALLAPDAETSDSGSQPVEDADQPQAQSDAESNISEPATSSVEVASDVAEISSVNQEAAPSTVTTTENAVAIQVEEVSVSNVEANQAAENPEQNKVQATIRTEEPKVQDAVVVEQASATDLPADANQVVVKFNQNSWFEVKDHRGRLIEAKEITAGTSKALQGEAPWRIVLGNARGVEISVDGKPYDFDHYIRGSVARFILTP